MTTEQIIALAKEKLGRDITEQEAQDYIDGKAAIPDEALDLVSGGAGCMEGPLCPACQQPSALGPYGYAYCNNQDCSHYQTGLWPEPNL